MNIKTPVSAVTVGRGNPQQPQVDDGNRPDDERQSDDMSRLEQRKENQRIANARGNAGFLYPGEERGDVHYCRSAGDQSPQT
jgi:hypothetical protein